MSDADPIEIEFFWDAGSTNTYFAFHLLRPIAASAEATIRFVPFNLGYVFRRHKYVLADEPRAKLANRRRDLMRWAERYSLAFRVPDKFPIKTSPALKGSLAARELGGADAEAAFIESVLERYWEHNDASVADFDGLVPIARAIGLDGRDFLALAQSQSIRAALVDATDSALARGVFGAPSMMLDGELYWGKDRMEFIEAQLQALRAAD